MKKVYVILFLLVTAMTAQAQTIVNIKGIRYILENGHAVVARQDKTKSGDIVIPAKISVGGTYYQVTRLLRPDENESGGGGAFQECDVNSVTLPDNITEIPAQTFQQCKNLTSVTLPASLTTVGDYAFTACPALETVALPDGVTELGRGAFSECSSLKTVNIPALVTTLSDELFLNTAIESFEIPATITRIGEYALANNALTEVKSYIRDVRTISYDVTSFGDVSKAELKVPAGGKTVYQEYYPWMDFKSITEFGEDTGEALVPEQRHVTIDGIRYMLKDDKATVAIQPVSLEGDIIIPEKVTYGTKDYPVTAIQDCYWSYGSHMNDERGAYHQSYRGAFTDTKITSVKLPASITTIGKFAFYRAENLQKAELAEGLTTIGDWAFAHCGTLTDINIPSTVTVLPYGSLAYCTSLKDFAIPEGVKKIEMECFIGSGIETLSIPSTCLQLGYQSLELPQLKTLYIKVKEQSDLKATDYNGEPVTMNGTVFGHDSDQAATRERLSGVDLIVPLGCADSYRVASPWLSFRSVTNENSPYLNLNGSAFSMPANAFSIEGTVKYEEHDGWYGQQYTSGLCIDNDTKVKFTTTSDYAWVYMYIFCSNSSHVKMDGKEVTEIGDNACESYSYYRYQVLVEKGDHEITCNGYEGNQVPVMFHLEVQDASGEYYQPIQQGVSIDGINYVLEEKTVEGQGEPIRTATIARQKTTLSGDIIIPATVRYAKTVLENHEWVTKEAYDYTVTSMVAPGFEIDEMPGYHRTTDGAFQECQISSISLPSTLTAIPSGAFNGCNQLKSATLAEGITAIGAGAFANCTSMEDIYLPETITDMSGWFIFGNCTSLKKVNIPASVNYISQGCFLESGIETFLIPTSIDSLGDYCFATDSLENIKICHKTLTAGSIKFSESNFMNIDLSKMTLFVPQGTKEGIYSQIYPWMEFGNIVEFVDQQDEHQYNAYRVTCQEEVEGEETAEARILRAAPAEKVQTVTFTPSGIPFALPEPPVKEDYEFVEWKEVPQLMPAHDVRLTAVYKSTVTKGDVNADKIIDVEDVVGIVNKILGSPAANFSEKAADVNGDGKIDVEDVVATVNIILGK